MLLATAVTAREYQRPLAVDSIDDVEALAAQGELDTATAALLMELLADPLDLNRAGAETLYQIPALSRGQARAIVAHRRRHGPFAALDDLTAVAGLRGLDLEYLRPWLTVRRPPWHRGIRGRARLAAIARRGYAAPQAGEALPPGQSYLQWEAWRGSQWGGGGVVSYRQQAEAFYDPGRGYLVSTGSENRAALDSLYFYRHGERWRGVGGNYTMGFGQQLTFDTSGRRHPDGWYLQRAVQTDLLGDDIRPPQTLFGGAASWRDPNRRLAVDAFVSHRARDAYQYDLRYGPDPWIEPALGACDSPGREREDFVCGDDGRWYSTRVFDAARDGQTHDYLTLNDAFTETLAGGRAALAFSENLRWSLIGYHGAAIMNMDVPELRFSPSAAYPQRTRFGAVGLAMDGQWDDLALAAELSRSDNGAWAAYGETSLNPSPYGDLALALRYFSARFDNPYTRARAARDETQGLAQRNEAGLRLEGNLGHPTGWAWGNVVDFWTAPYEWRQGRWQRRNGPVHVHWRQRLGLPPHGAGRVTLYSEWTDKDLGRGGRDESYDGEAAAGERRKAGLLWRLPWDMPRMSLDYWRSWEDVAGVTHRFDHEQQLRLRLQWQPRPRTRVGATATRRFQPLSGEHGVAYSRAAPARQLRLDLNQRLHARLDLALRYANVVYQDPRPDRYARYHLFRLRLSSEF